MSTCSHVREPVAKAEAVALALNTAEARCTSKGERWTPPRQRTYELLLRAGAPVKAYDLISSYAATGQPLAKPATIYRALDFLLIHGLAHRLESLNAFVACGADHATHAATFLICDCCGRAQELTLGLDPTTASAAEARGFTVGRAVLELHGACEDCG
jgi:Fur family zinc uptake transcriptional regulator